MGCGWAGGGGMCTEMDRNGMAQPGLIKPQMTACTCVMVRVGWCWTSGLVLDEWVGTQWIAFLPREAVGTR